MNGFYAGVPDAWAIAAEHLPKPWPEECAVNDLRWWADRVRLGREERLPSRRALMARWGWTSWRVRTLVDDEARWRDPITAHPPPTRRPPAAHSGNVERRQFA